MSESSYNKEISKEVLRNLATLRFDVAKDIYDLSTEDVIEVIMDVKAEYVKQLAREDQQKRSRDAE